MKPIRILAVLPNPADATSYYRAMGPLSYLIRSGDVEVRVNPPLCNWDEILMQDIVFLQRPFRPEDGIVADMAKHLGKKIWVDLDDWLFDVPKMNPSYSTFASSKTQTIMATVIQSADLVTVSTPYLKQLLEAHTTTKLNIVVIPNALDDQLLTYARPYQRKAMIAWRGSKSHKMDLVSYCDEIVAFSKENREIEFVFMGHPASRVTESLGARCRVIEPVPTYRYHKALADLNAPTVMVPLEDSPFNRAKSNIAWIEGVLTGAVSVGPDWIEWIRPGNIGYATLTGGVCTRSFKEALHFAQDDHAEYHRQAMEFVQEELLLSKVNPTRLEALQSIL